MRFRDDLANSLPKFATRQVDEAVVKKVLGLRRLRAGRRRRPADLRTARPGARRVEHERADQGQSPVLSGDAAGGVCADRQPARRVGPCARGKWRVAAHHHREAVRHRSRSARALNRKLLGVLEEDQIYRIDHYLGKETVQNILVLRFANGLFEPIWNRDHIDHVQITVAERSTVGRRGNYLRCDRRAARHGAEPSVPAAVARRHGAAVAFRRRRRAGGKGASCSTPSRLQTARRRCAIRCARNTATAIVENQPVEDYRKTKDVKPDSTTETYVALKLDDRQLALGGRAVLSAHRQGAARQARPRWRSSSSRRRSPCSATRRSIVWRRISWCSAFSRTNASACSSTPRCRGPRSRSAASA